MAPINQKIHDTLLNAEDALTQVMAILDPNKAGDRGAMHLLQEAYGAIAGLRRDLEDGQWPERPRVQRR